MKNPVFLAVVFLAMVLSGCAGKMPQTADEFRKALPGSFMGKVETFEANRPFEAVARTFQTMAPKCLDVRIKTTSRTSTSYQVIVAKYHPTVVVTKQRAELHVQEKHESGVVAVYEEPAKGHYLMVVYATPLDEKRTKITMYRPSRGNDAMVKAIKGWAAGDIAGCPDLTQ